MKTLFLSLLISLSALGDDFNPRTDIIAVNYEAGAYLIYDCQEKHWVCVQESFYTDCVKTREAARRLTDYDTLFCAPIGKFPTKQSCYQRMLFLTTHHHGNRFCLRDDLRTKVIDFE